MALSITERSSDDVVILDLEGAWTSGTDVSLLRHLTDLVDRGRHKVLLNVTGVRRWGSVGLGELVRGLMVLDRHGGVLKVLDGGRVGAPGRLQELLARSQMLKAFEVFRSEDAGAPELRPPLVSRFPRRAPTCGDSPTLRLRSR